MICCMLSVCLSLSLSLFIYFLWATLAWNKHDDDDDIQLALDYGDCHLSQWTDVTQDHTRRLVVRVSSVIREPIGQCPSTSSVSCGWSTWSRSETCLSTCQSLVRCLMRRSLLSWSSARSWQPASANESRRWKRLSPKLQLSCRHQVRVQTLDTRDGQYDTIRYDTIEEFNVDSKAECDQLNLAHVAGKIKRKKLKQSHVSAHFVQYRFKIRESSPEGTVKTMEERICDRDEFYVWIERSRER